MLLLTGAPGVGKTTIIRAVAERLSNRRLGGFFTRELRAGIERQGFELVTFDGRRAVIAHVARTGPPRVGKYGVDIAAIEAMTRSALAVRQNVDVYLVDEIGKMESLSPAFVAAARTLLAGNTPVVATVGQRGGGFLAEVRALSGATLWEVTRANRDAMADRVQTWIGCRAGSTDRAGRRARRGSRSR